MLRLREYASLSMTTLLSFGGRIGAVFDVIAIEAMFIWLTELHPTF